MIGLECMLCVASCVSDGQSYSGIIITANISHEFEASVLSSARSLIISSVSE